MVVAVCIVVSVWVNVVYLQKKILVAKYIQAIFSVRFHNMREQSVNEYASFMVIWNRACVDYIGLWEV